METTGEKGQGLGGRGEKKGGGYADEGEGGGAVNQSGRDTVEKHKS